MEIIDLRSDTVTRPSTGMREVIANAEVGDDVYGEDPTVNKLEQYLVQLSGKESALFVPSGTMGNQLCLKALTNPGDEVIIEEDAHIYYYETGAPAFISNIQLRPLPSHSGEIELQLIRKAIREDIYYFPKTAVISLENTHNRHGGKVLSLDYIKQVSQLARENNIKMHLDGARLWNAIAETGITFREYAQYFDTINVCFSKALGAPIGSAIVGDKETIKKAHKWRKILGGGMRQAGIIASACLYAIEHNFPLLKNDHSNAKQFAKSIFGFAGLSLEIESVETNMVVFELASHIKDSEFIKQCKTEGLLLSGVENNRIRTVFHLDINSEQTQNAVEIVKVVLDRLGA